MHHLVRVLEAGGESAAAELVAALGSKAEIARKLAYRLYTICERKKRAAEALSYNGLVQSWPEITRLAREGARSAAMRSLGDRTSLGACRPTGIVAARERALPVFAMPAILPDRPNGPNLVVNRIGALSVPAPEHRAQ